MADLKIPSVKGLIKDGVADAINDVANGASKIIEDFKADPNKVLDTNVELEKLKNEALAKADDYAVQMETQYTEQQKSVNETMQAESKSEHFMQWAWRPTVGFTFCAILINNYILLPYFPKLHTIIIPTEIWMTIGAVLGVASLGRSATYWQREKNSGQ